MIKKYSDKFLNNYKTLSQTVVGIEWEFFTNDLSYYKTMELLNIYFKPMEVYGFNTYHPDFKPNKKQIILSPDLSGGKNMCEIIFPPLPYLEAKYMIIKMGKFLEQYNCYTTEKASIHFNISFKDKSLNDLNILKLILATNEDQIYNCYPHRKNNIYAKSVKKIIPYKDYDFYNIPISVIKNNLRLPNDKYFGINFLHINESKESQRLEFRYIGGKDYEKNIGQLLYFLDKFIVDSYNAIGGDFTDAEITNLENYLKDNISNFKNFSKYDNFIVEFPSVSLQIDQNNLYDIVSAQYDKLYNKLYNFIDSTNSIKDCIINYVTGTHTMEIVDGEIDLNLNVQDYDFINCHVTNGIFTNCNFVNTEITDSQILKSKIDGCTIKNSKVLSCKVESSTLDDCFFMNGYLNSEMNSGIFRSGKLGPYATLSSDTKIVTDKGSFFNTKYEEGDEKDEKGKFGGEDIKGFKK